MGQNIIFKQNLTSEIEFDDFEIGDDHRWFGGRLLVIVVPFATQTFGFIPHFDELFVVLDDDRVLVELALGVRFRSASVVDDGETEIGAARFRVDVDAVVLAELALGEDEAGEGLVERQLHFHVILGAHHFQILNLRKVHRAFLLPRFLTERILTHAHLITNSIQLLFVN